MADAVARSDSEQYIDWALNFHRSLVRWAATALS